MRAVVLRQAGEVGVEQVPDPVITDPGDAIVRVVAAAVCGSDLWMLRGVADLPRAIRTGHEFVGVVVETGPAVHGPRIGQFVICPFQATDGTCSHCRRGFPIACERGRFFGEFDQDGEALDGGQAEYVRVPFADTTLVALDDDPGTALLPHLLTLSDVMATGHEAARHAGVRLGATVVVVGDGAVAQCAVLASRRLGADRVVVMSGHEPRQRLAVRNGASDVVASRGAEGVAEVTDLVGGVDHVVEAVGTLASMRQAIGCARPGARIGYVGLPWGVELPLWDLFGKNLVLSGGGANVRTAIPELLPDVLDGSLTPGDVFDASFPLAAAAAAFAAMNERRCVKALLSP